MLFALVSIDSLAVQILDALQQLHECQAGFTLAVASPLQHSLKQLTACDQLSDEVHLADDTTGRCESGEFVTTDTLCTAHCCR